MITYFLQISYLVILLLSTMFSIWQWAKFGLRKQYGFSIYLLIVMLTELAIGLYGSTTHKNPSMIYNLALPLHGLALSMVYAFEWKSNVNRQLHRGLTLLFILPVIYFLSTRPMDRFIDNNGLLLAGFYVICSLHWFFYQVNKPDELGITRKLLFWVSTGLISWCIVFIFRMMLKDYLNQMDPAFLTNLQILLSLLNMTIYLLFMKGLSCLR